jgi:hypothetical protein
MEDNQNNELEYTYKVLLIEYISLLLKDDWERSKTEVKGENTKTLKYILFIFSIICSIFHYFQINY